MMKKKIEGHEAEYDSRRCYPIYNDYTTGSYSMDYNSIWSRPNLLYVLEIEQWNFINDLNKPAQYHKDKYFQCTLLDVTKKQVESLGYYWKLELTAKGNYYKTPMSYDLLTITLTDRYKEVKTYNTTPDVNSVARVLKEANEISKHPGLIHYKHFLQTQELNQRIQYLSTSKESLQLENETVKQENLALTERVKKLEEFAARVRKMSSKLKLPIIK